MFSENICIPFTLYYNINEGSLYNKEDLARQDSLALRFRAAASGPWLKKIVLRQSPNQGKDIGGKLVLLDAWLREGQDDGCCVFFHDKNSPHKAQGREWQETLSRIITPAFTEKAIGLFEKTDRVGIVCKEENIANEYDHSTHCFISNNRDLLRQLQSAYDIHTDDYRFVAGTMFWARSRPLSDFFRKHAPLEIRRTLEQGNVMDDKAGTYTHSWERLLSWLIFANGYSIKGL